MAGDTLARGAAGMLTYRSLHTNRSPRVIHHNKLCTNHIEHYRKTTLYTRYEKDYQYLVYHPSALITAATQQGIDLERESSRLVGISFQASAKHSAILFLTATDLLGKELKSGNFWCKILLK